MKGRIRLFVRGLRRRLSNLAWALGGGSVLTLIAGSIARKTLPLAALPSWFALGVTGAIFGALVATALGLLVSGFLLVPRDAEVVRGDYGVRVKGGGLRREFAYTDITGMLRHGERVWLVLRSGNVLDLAMEDLNDARELESAVRERIGRRRLELAPHPTFASTVLVVFTLITSCSATAGAAQLTGAEGIFPALMVLGTTIAAAAAVGGAMRGSTFVLGHDGIRVGKVFYAFEELTKVQMLKQRVTLTFREGESQSFRVRMPDELAAALKAEIARRMSAEGVEEAVFERREDETLRAWARRVQASIREGGFRDPVMLKERVRVAALDPRSPLRVRVAALAGLMDEPEFAEELAQMSADPRLARVAEASREGAEAWDDALKRLESEGVLE